MSDGDGRKRIKIRFFVTLAKPIIQAAILPFVPYVRTYHTNVLCLHICVVKHIKHKQLTLEGDPWLINLQPHIIFSLSLNLKYHLAHLR